MAKFDIEPWPSTYKMNEGVEPSKLVSDVEGRDVGAFRTSIPACTIEPPQIHLISPRDGAPFQELLTGFDRSLCVAYYNPGTGGYSVEKYSKDEDVVIPAFKIHWLMNFHNRRLNFTCEYAPHPWDGDVDEPEFRNLTTLLQFVDENSLRDKLI